MNDSKGMARENAPLQDFGPVRRGRLLVWLASEQSATWVPLAVFALVYSLDLLLIGLLNHGVFGFTLDDAYIHLALAENIARGHYGINLGEYSTPSSSILWPFLLAPFAAFSTGRYAPFALNFACSVGVILIFERIIRSALGASGSSSRFAVMWLVNVGLILASNVIGVAFTGMEHSLQSLLAALVVWGLIREREERNIPWWFALAIVCGPLVRYENLALSVPALAYLLWRGYFRTALGCSLVLATLLLGASIFFWSINGGWLPTSIMGQSGALGNGIRGFVGHLQNSLRDRQVALMCVGVFLFFPVIVSRRWQAEDRALGGVMATAVVLHLLFGNSGPPRRHEMYIWTTLLLALLYLYRSDLRTLVSYTSLRALVVFGGAFVIAVALPSIKGTLGVPWGSSNIYEQQYQMHRFVTEYYRAPVAINDLGWVSYHNDNYVLDLWGLASPQALALRKQEQGSQWMNTLADQHHVRLAMIYDGWLPDVPGNWLRIGELELGRSKTTVACSIVTFYALDRSTLDRASPLLRMFQTTLPPGVKFTFQQPGTDSPQRAIKSCSLGGD